MALPVRKTARLSCQDTKLGLNLYAGPSEAQFQQLADLPERRFDCSDLLQNQVLYSAQ